MANKAIIAGLSSTLLVAAVIGVIATVASTRGTQSTTDDLNTSTKSIATLCSQTDYQDVCMRTIGHLNSSSDPEEFIQAAFNAAAEEINVAIDLSKNVSQGASDEFNKNAFKDCQDLLQDAAEELQAALSESEDIQGIARRSDDIKTWLSAVITYQQTCIDGITQPELQSTMQSGLRTATKITSNAIAIVDALTELIKSLDITDMNITDMNITTAAGNRRLMSNDMYPSWFSAHDRKLLAAHDNGKLTPNVVVAKDGSGDFKTINDALKAVPKKYTGDRYIIYVKAGVYKEIVLVDDDMPQIFMYGDGPRKTIVTGSLNNVDGVGTMHTATFAVESQGFIGKSMGFTNSAGAVKHQAVALRVKADMAAFFNCRMDGYQDTLYVHAHRQFYRNCVISGTIDFIFGDSTTVIQNSLIVLRRPLDNQQNTVTAHGRAENRETTALVLQNCRIVPDKSLFPDRFKLKSYLGRPWKAHSRTIVMESTIGDVIQPEGWMSWQGANFEKTLYYAEYNNRGPGAATSGRVNWPGFHVIGKAEAERYTVDTLLHGSDWIKYTGIKYFGGFKN